MKKTLITSMFSSVSDAELVTAMLDAADLKENQDLFFSDFKKSIEFN